MEHLFNQHVDEGRMHEGYRQRETTFREEAAKLWTEEAKVRESLRGAPDLSAEERQDAYRVRYGEIETRFESLAEKFSADVSREISEAQELLSQGTGSKFSEYLTSVSQIRDEKLPEIMATARRSGQSDLERAIAIIAYERGVRPVWSSWAEANPERAEAVKLLRSTPGAEQFGVRTGTMRPPRAEEVDLEPTAADLEAQAETSEKAAAARKSFFAARSSMPRRQVGGRIA